MGNGPLEKPRLNPIWRLQGCPGATTINIVILNMGAPLNHPPTPMRAQPPHLQHQRFLARARQFRRVAMPLPDMDSAEPNWPKWFLITHAIELTIKAYIHSREELNVPAPTAPVPANHDLVALYDYAVSYGLKRDPEVTKDLPHLSELHQQHYARYPQEAVKPVALIAQYDDLIDRLIEEVSEAALR